MCENNGLREYCKGVCVCSRPKTCCKVNTVMGFEVKPFQEYKKYDGNLYLVISKWYVVSSK